MKTYLQTLLLILTVSFSALAQTPVYSNLYYTQVQQSSENPKAEIEVLSKKLAEDKLNPQALQQRSEYYIQIQKFGKANKDAKTLIKSYPEKAIGYFLRAQVRIGRENMTGALKDLNKALDMNPAFTEARLLRGIVKGNLGDLIGDIEDQTDILSTHKTNKFALLERSYAKLKLMDYRGAEADLDKAIEVDPLFIDAYLQRGYIKSLAGDKKGALIDTRIGDNLRKGVSQNLAELREND